MGVYNCTGILLDMSECASTRIELSVNLCPVGSDGSKVVTI